MRRWRGDSWSLSFGLGAALAASAYVLASYRGKWRRRRPSRALLGALEVVREKSMDSGARLLGGGLLAFQDERWPPSTRSVAAGAGAFLALAGLRGRRPASPLLAFLGVGLLLRGVTNYPLARLIGLRPARIAVHETLELAAPVEEVYRAWDVEKFPRFMSHVNRVQNLGGDRYHFEVEGPAGIPIEWTAAVTRREPCRLLIWATEAGSPVSHVGMVRFERLGDRRSRISVHLTYDPPAGALGHAVAWLLGADPKSELDRDLLRFRHIVEQGLWVSRWRGLS